jgi:RNA polymerase sigma-70 factor (ECF subfamily)
MREPIDTSADPVQEAERGEALKFGMRILLQTLSPTERTAYILREAFGYAYRDIARILRLQEANARQVVTRARHRVSQGARMPVTCTGQRHLVEPFIAAVRNGDPARLEALLT